MKNNEEVILTKLRHKTKPKTESQSKDSEEIILFKSKKKEFNRYLYLH